MDKMFIIGIAIVALLCALVLGIAAFVDISMAVQSGRERRRRRRLEKRTVHARVRSLTGTVSGRHFSRDHYYVTVSLGQRTELDFDDEDAYYALRVGEKVDVYVREHFDATDTLFARIPMGLDFYH